MSLPHLSCPNKSNSRQGHPLAEAMYKTIQWCSKIFPQSDPVAKEEIKPQTVKATMTMPTLQTRTHQSKTREPKCIQLTRTLRAPGSAPLNQCDSKVSTKTIAQKRVDITSRSRHLWPITTRCLSRLSRRALRVSVDSRLISLGRLLYWATMCIHRESMRLQSPWRPNPSQNRVQSTENTKALKANQWLKSAASQVQSLSNETEGQKDPTPAPTPPTRSKRIMTSRSHRTETLIWRTLTVSNDT